MNETIKTILNRRSYRAYRPEQIKDEELSLILDCALHAPSAMNSQEWHFTVVQNRPLIEWMNEQIKEALPEASKERIKGRFGGSEDYNVFYYAPTVIIVSGLEQDPYMPFNCSFATQNICLAAESLHIGSCILGFAAFLFQSPQREAAMKRLEIPANYKPLYGIALGYKDRDAIVPERIPNKVNFIK